MTFVAALLLATQGKVPASRTYTNARYAFSVEVPAFVRLKRAADNGDGWTFLSPDVRTELLAYGTTSLLDQKGDIVESLGGGYRGWVRQSRQPGMQGQSSAINARAFSVSWRDGRRFVRIRAIKIPEGFAVVEVRYPVDRKPAVERAVTRTLASLSASKR